MPGFSGGIDGQGSPAVSPEQFQIKGHIMVPDWEKIISQRRER
jgi:hypothetical protein